jgi:integrase
MPAELVLLPQLAPEAVERAHDFALASKSDATKRAYASDWKHFVSWGGQLPSPPALVAVYVSELASEGYRPATIERRLAAIREAHRAAGFEPPVDGNLRAVVKGIRRKLGVAQRQARPVTVDQLRDAVASLPVDAAGMRDKAMLLLGFAGAFRRSELVSLDVQDLVFEQTGVKVTLRRSKTDQEGAGRVVGVPIALDESMCPIRALRDWLFFRRPGPFPLFVAVNNGRVTERRLDGRAVCEVVKRRLGDEFSGHSLRAGLVTAAAKSGKSVASIMKQTGHRSVNMVQRYVRDAELLGKDNAAAGVL